MTSRRPCLCTKKILWELNPFHMLKLLLFQAICKAVDHVTENDLYILSDISLKVKQTVNPVHLLWCVQENFCENLCLRNRILLPQQVAQILSDLILCDKILLRRQRFSRKNSSVTQSDLSRALRRVAATCLINQSPLPSNLLSDLSYTTSQNIKTLT